MGVISDSINLLNKSPNDKKDMIALPTGKVLRRCPIELPDGEKVEGRMESYNRRTQVLKVSFTTKDGKKHLSELTFLTSSKEKGKDSGRDEEVAVFSVSGKLVYLSLLPA